MTSSDEKTAEELIEELGLIPMGDGACLGWFRESHRSSSLVLNSPKKEERNAVSVIYHLITHGQKVSWHRMKNNDEIIVFNKGKPVKMEMISSNGEYKSFSIGINSWHCTVPSGVWFKQQAMTSKSGEYSLYTACVAPGFDERDAEFKEIGEMEKLFPHINFKD